MFKNCPPLFLVKTKVFFRSGNYSPFSANRVWKEFFFRNSKTFPKNKNATKNVVNCQNLRVFIFQKKYGVWKWRLVGRYSVKWSFKILKGLLIFFVFNFSKIHEKKFKKHTPPPPNRWFFGGTGGKQIFSIILICFGLLVFRYKMESQ